MTLDPQRHQRTAPQDILETINRFRSGEIRLEALLNRLWDQIHDLPHQPSGELGKLEDLWTDIEITYAQASAAKQSAMNTDQTIEIEHAIESIFRVIDTRWREEI